jgi:hypothetical protein
MRRTVALAVLLLPATASATEHGAIVRPSEISIDENPAKLRLRGGIVVGGKVEEDAITELSCPAGEEADCVAQWKRMLTSHCYAVGWDFAPPVVVKTGVPSKAVPWATSRGVREIALNDVRCAAVPGDAPIGPAPTSNVVAAEAGTVPPPGFHAEDRLHHGALFTGLGLIVAGGSIALLSSSGFMKDGAGVFGAALAVGGVGFFAYGLTTHRVFVRDRVSIAPVVSPKVAGAAVTIVF